MFCKFCGAELPDGSTFCTNCGAKLTEETAENNAGSTTSSGALAGFRKKMFEPKLAKLLTIIFMFVAAGSNMLVTFGNFANTFMGVVGDLITLVFETLIYASVAVLLLVGKVELAKKALYPIFAYWLISTILGDLAMSGNVVAGANSLVIVYSLFEFALALLLIAAAVLFVLSAGRKEALANVAWILVLCVLALSALALLLRLIRLIDVGANWTRYFGILCECAFNFGMIFAVSAVSETKE